MTQHSRSQAHSYLTTPVEKPNRNHEVNIKWLFVCITLALFSRFLPHTPNFTPVIGVAMFAGSYLSQRWSYLVPLSVMLLSDFILGWHNTLPFVYIAILGAVVLGEGLKGKNELYSSIRGWMSAFSAATGSSILFFVVTNFGVWLVSGLYTQNLAGLVNCFVSAIPFFPATFVSTVAYFFALVGARALLKRLKLHPYPVSF